MKNTKSIWFLPYRYIAPADIENLLEKMAAEGWHIDRIFQLDSFCMKFCRSTPKKYRYVVDLHAKICSNDYISTYESFGWEFVGKMASLYVWRMAYTEERPEAFTDSASVHERSDNISRVLLIMALSIAAILAPITISFFLLGGWQAKDGILGYGITLGLCVLLIAVLLIARHVVKKNRNR